MCFGNRTQEMDSFYRRKSRYRFEGELNLSRCISRSYSSSNVFEDRVDNFSFPCGPKQDDDNQLLLRRVNRKYYFKARSLTSLKIDCTDILPDAIDCVEALIKSSSLSKLFGIIPTCTIYDDPKSKY